MSEDAVAERVEMSEAEKFFAIAGQNQELFRSLQIVVPIRPAEGLDPRFVRMLTIWSLAGIEWDHLIDYGGGFLEVTRANIAHRFLHEMPDKKYILMIDADMLPDIWLPWHLVRHEQTVVGACAMSLHDDFGPQLCFTVQDADGKWRFPASRYTERIPKFGLMKVGHVGTGAMCVRRDVFEAFKWEPGDIPFYVRETIRMNGAKTGKLLRGEDIEFCWQVRGKGMDVFVDLEAHVGHRKTAVWRWDDVNRDPFMKHDEWVIDSRGLVIGADDE